MERLFIQIHIFIMMDFYVFLRAKLKHECAQKGIVGKKFNDLRGDISEEFIKKPIKCKENISQIWIKIQS
ncbi:hypothetical protein [Vibrio alginolyticus]|uniref:hypothetical protein n=1 Tax=Vibrio alginolyticus TaxID=663 RepID=UPI0019D62DC2|nr:hypothetical protein [Vibrio alginolyticus]